MQFRCCRESFNGAANLAGTSDVSYRPHKKLKTHSVNVIQNGNNRFLNKWLAGIDFVLMLQFKMAFWGFKKSHYHFVAIVANVHF